MQFATRIRTMRSAHWLAVYGLILAGWAVLYAMSLPADLRAAGQFYGADFWEALCTVTPDAAGLLKLWLMWAAMSAAMMVPTFLPAIATYEELPQPGSVLELLAGYMIIWLGFSALAAGVQMALVQADVVTPIGTSGARWFTVLLLGVAGAYQFSAFKDSCLAKCRHPLTFFMQYWSHDRWNAVSMGLRLGAYCLGCCWALMALAFVGGTMNLVWMGLATAMMVFEKLPDLGRHLTRPLGFVLIGAAVLTALGVI